MNKEDEVLVKNLKEKIRCLEKEIKTIEDKDKFGIETPTGVYIGSFQLQSDRIPSPRLIIVVNGGAIAIEKGFQISHNNAFQMKENYKIDRLANQKDWDKLGLT